MLVYVFGNYSSDQSTLKNSSLVGILPHWMIRDAFQKLFLPTLLPDTILLTPRWVCNQSPCVCRSVSYAYDYFARCLEMRDSSSLDSFLLYRTDFLSIYHLDIHSFIPRQTHPSAPFPHLASPFPPYITNPTPTPPTTSPHQPAAPVPSASSSHTRPPGLSSSFQHLPPNRHPPPPTRPHPHPTPTRSPAGTA